MEPSDAEMDKMQVLGDIFNWVKIKDEPRDAFLKDMGMKPGDHWRDLAILKKDEIEGVIAGLKVGTQPAAPGIRGGVGAWLWVAYCPSRLCLCPSRDSYDRAAADRQV